MSAPPIVCTQCTQEAPHWAHGLCRVCYWYQRRTGRPRPRSLDVGPQRCVGCDRLLTPQHRHAFGACRACYQIWRNWRRRVTRRPWYPERIAAVQRAVDAKRAAREAVA